MLLRDCDFAIWHVHYTFDEAVRKPTYGGMDSEFSHYNRDQKGYKCVVAPNASMAEAAFKTSMGEKPNDNYKSIDSVIKIHDVDIMVRM